MIVVPSPPSYQELPENSTVFTFTERDYKDTTLQDASSRTLYWIKTSNKVTRVFRPSQNSPKECIAEFEWHTIDNNTSKVTYAGATQTLREMFPNDLSVAAGGRKMQTPIGDCVWKSSKPDPFLVDINGKRIVAKALSNKHIFQPSSAATISVADEVLAMGFLDLIILGWIVATREKVRAEKVLKATTKLVNWAGP
ncbi:hypothetical protein DL93DRAFT_2078929 [Clavulina sp. PMI_390]|nr:hypothetical protein DL93DRAFT_2078929 [Clavulina sp. PMI_390]